MFVKVNNKFTFLFFYFFDLGYGGYVGLVTLGYDFSPYLVLETSETVTDQPSQEYEDSIDLRISGSSIAPHWNNALGVP